MTADLDEGCADCGAELSPATEPAGIIFARVQVDGHWLTAGVCTACMRVRRPDLVEPHRMRWAAYLEGERA